jgi:hypothetical protein
MNKQSTDTGLIHSLDGKRTITVEEFDRIFDDGSDEIDEFVDWSKAKRAHEVIKRVNLDLPIWMIARMDREATHLGITRQALIKTWIGEKLEGRPTK